jgi:hypothetical protein
MPADPNATLDRPHRGETPFRSKNVAFARQSGLSVRRFNCDIRDAAAIKQAAQDLDFNSSGLGPSEDDGNTGEPGRPQRWPEDS